MSNQQMLPGFIVRRQAVIERAMGRAITAEEQYNQTGRDMYLTQVESNLNVAARAEAQIIAYCEQEGIECPTT